MKPPVLDAAATNALHALCDRLSSLLIAADCMLDGSSLTDRRIAHNVGCELLAMACELAEELREWR